MPLTCKQCQHPIVDEVFAGGLCVTCHNLTRVGRATVASTRLDCVIILRVTQRQSDAYKEHARALEVDRSAWIRRTLDYACDIDSQDAARAIMAADADYADQDAADREADDAYAKVRDS